MRGSRTERWAGERDFSGVEGAVKAMEEFLRGMLAGWVRVWSWGIFMHKQQRLDYTKGECVSGAKDGTGEQVWVL